MKHTLLFTGATGAFGSLLLQSLLQRDDIERIYVLSRKADTEIPSPKVVFVRGDVTDARNCGLAPQEFEQIAGTTTAILNGAADTQFSAPRERALLVNVEGTRNVLAVAAQCQRLERFGQLSTIYVAGKRRGKICEGELLHESGFVNAYEESKYEAEKLLWSPRDKVPVSIFRLSTMIGDSRTGYVGQISAVHHALRFFYRSLAPVIPGSPESPVDLIPSDYAVNAVRELFWNKFVAGKAYHICAGSDSVPLAEFLDLTRVSFLRHRPSWRNRAIEKPAIVDLATFDLFGRTVEEIGDTMLVRSVGAIKHFAPQLAYPKQFDDTECAAALADAGIRRPELREVLPRVIQWLMTNTWNGAALPETEAA